MAAKQNPEDIFNKAVEITDPAEQAVFLDQACAGDEKLRAEVDALLKWNQEAGSFLDVAGSDGTATLDGDTVPDASGTVLPDNMQDVVGVHGDLVDTSVYGGRLSAG